MNFALLGGDPVLLPLLRAISADAGHRLVLAAGVPDGFAGELLQAAPGTRIGGNWQEVLNDPSIDAVIAVARDEEAELGVKQIASSGTAILLVPNGDPKSSLAYELSLVRDDSGVPLMPLFPLRCDPRIAGLEAEIGGQRSEVGGQKSEVGSQRSSSEGHPLTPSPPHPLTHTPISLHVERTIPVAGSPPLLSSRNVYDALICDADLLRQLGGSYSQVTAVFSGPSAEEIALATITLAGEGLPTATWILRPTAESGESRVERRESAGSQRSTLNSQPGHGFELSITAHEGVLGIRSDVAPGAIPSGAAEDFEVVGNVGQAGKADVREAFQPDPNVENASSAEESLGQPGKPDLRPGDVAREILRRMESAAKDRAQDDHWTGYMRAVEIVEAASRSIRRRRTIDLHFETTSERNQFKTQMTAVGCSLLMMTLAAFVFVLMAGALFNLHPAVMRVLRIGIFLPLVLFLLLQFLLLIARPARDSQTEKRSSDGEPG